ncbi:15-hydroxyprostaglandin dehydrogenase [NAD(+)] [Aplysia californica]|uniref:15-hydroxyprostaglandin dehydrogenase [NAD(+)] n=1 Tax=Aplysia californica TaxID=6500 RepID=A0ABM1AEF0_APLCA|nr:15-hydroxyprostaglandin dehydrogenase [NAD(+)] [Aplysia californica]
MINNAAIMNEARWELMIDINVKSLIWGTEMAASHMRKDKGGRGGRIINIISALGLTTNFPSPIYSATKHAVRAYTSSLAQEPTLPQQGIEYALIAPDIVDTPLIRALDNSRMHHHDQLKDFIRDKQMEPHIVAEGLLQLLHLDNINGAVLSVEKERKTFRHVENVDDGPTFDPSKSAAGYV